MLKIIITADGSHSLLNETLNETYHSVHGALQESRHVFIKHGLAFVAQRDWSPIFITEVGFGTGLNALLSLQFAEEHQRNLHYRTIESSPLAENIWSKLNYAPSLGLDQEYRSIHEARWNALQTITPFFDLLKLETTMQQATLPSNSTNIVYYDAFAPSKQPTLWELPLLRKAFDCLKPGGVFVTYCAKGQLKRDLKDSGFLVETLPGPPGKKEMVRALKS